MKSNKSSVFALNTVRKKVLMLSKSVGGIIVLFYFATLELPVSSTLSFWIWFCLMLGVILGVDFLLGRLISDPLSEINHTARQMAKLDYTARCRINTNDEFGELSQNLNSMFSNLQDALEQRKELANSLSHEMKTPLGLIQAYAEGLKDETDDEKKQEYIDAILSATERMDHLIVSLLDLSALEAGACVFSEERFDFVELTETIAGRLLLDTPETAYHFDYELPDCKLFINADKSRMEQVLSNLFENAKKYVCKDGNIYLSVTFQNEYLYFSVFNQGLPIPEKELSKIWDKFYRIHNTRQSGSGLGLAIVSQILSTYNVPYGVHNQNDGVEFYFQFPLA